MSQPYPTDELAAIRRTQRKQDVDLLAVLNHVDTAHADLHGVLGGHGAILGGHTAALAAHTATLGGHTAALAAHTATLAEHGAALARLEAGQERAQQLMEEILLRLPPPRA